MTKYFLILLTFMSISCFLTSCELEHEQKNEINVTGRVTDELGFSIPNTTIFIDRGKSAYFSPAVYSSYDSIQTDAHGAYSYTAPYDHYSYNICCGTPEGFHSNSTNSNCQEVDMSIKNGKTAENTINFSFTRNAQ